METVRHVLVVSSRISDDAEVFRRFAPALQHVECELHRVPRGTDVLELVDSTSFDLVVVCVPLGLPPAQLVIRTIRQEGSACRRSAVLVVARGEDRTKAESLLEDGVNRVVSLDDPGDQIVAVLSQLLGVAPRVALQSALRVELEVDDGPGRVTAEIGNLSISGMLVHGAGRHQRGARLDFELWLPDEDESIRGMAEVVREVGREDRQTDGFAARFLAFREVGRQRLEAFLMAEMARAGEGNEA